MGIPITQNKRKLTFLPAVLLLFILAITIPSITAHAAEANQSNAGGDGQTNNNLEDGVSGGADQNKSGFRVYIVDSTGAIKSKVVDLYHKNPSYTMAMWSTRIGNGTATEDKQMPSDMPIPFDYVGNSFVGNGEAVRQWMISTNESGEQRGYRLIHDYLGSDAYNMFIDDSTTYYLVLEPITWHAIFLSRSATSNSGIGFYGTFYNWMQVLNANSLSDGGFTYPLDNNVLGRCLQLVRDQPDLGLSLPTTSGKLNLNNIGNQGFGIQLYWNHDFDGGEPGDGGNSTHTWDSTNHPHDEGDPPTPPPTVTDPTQLQYTIIKSYRLKNNGVLTHVTTTWRTSTVATITIEDEPLNDSDKNYKVIGWKQSTTTNFNITSTPWNPPNYIDQTGTSKGSTTLHDNYKVLYVLLEAEIEDEPTDGDINYTLPESSITKKINYSLPDYSNGDMATKLNTVAFGFYSAPHTPTTCDSSLTV